MNTETTCQQCIYYNTAEETGDISQCERCPVYRAEEGDFKQRPDLQISLKKQENRYRLYKFFIRIHNALKNKRQLEIARILLCYGDMPSRFIASRTGIPERTVRQYRENLKRDLPEIFADKHIV